MWTSWLLLGCAEPPTPVVAPESHTWVDEAELVVKGLDEVEALHAQGQRAAARTLAARVYTERYEPRLEPALRQAEGDLEATRVEYQFGQLTVSVEGADGKLVGERVDALQRRVRAAAQSAASAFPVPGSVAAPAGPRREARPEVPDVPPNWEAGETPTDADDASLPEPAHNNP